MSNEFIKKMSSNAADIYMEMSSTEIIDSITNNKFCFHDIDILLGKLEEQLDENIQESISKPFVRGDGYDVDAEKDIAEYINLSEDVVERIGKHHGILNDNFYKYLSVLIFGYKWALIRHNNVDYFKNKLLKLFSNNLHFSKQRFLKWVRCLNDRSRSITVQFINKHCKARICDMDKEQQEVICKEFKKYVTKAKLSKTKKTHYKISMTLRPGPDPEKLFYNDNSELPGNEFFRLTIRGEHIAKGIVFEDAPAIIMYALIYNYIFNKKRRISASDIKKLLRKYNKFNEKRHIENLIPSKISHLRKRLDAHKPQIAIEGEFVEDWRLIAASDEIGFYCPQHFIFLNKILPEVFPVIK